MTLCADVLRVDQGLDSCPLGSVERFKLSVIIPTFNKAPYLARLLPSLSAQQLSPQWYEVIVVDDGSTDHTAEVARQFEGQFAHFRYVWRANGGIGAARNTGLQWACGELICFLADDYVLDPQYLSKMAAALNDPEVQGVRPLFASLGASPVEMAMHIGMISTFKTMSPQVRPVVYRFPAPIAWGGASVTRRSVFDAHGPFCEDYATGEDSEYAYRLARQGIHIHVYDEVLFRIQNRTNFFKAVHRLYEYALNGQRLRRQLRQSAAAWGIPDWPRPPLWFRLARFLVRPLLDVFRHTDSTIQALTIVPVAYAMQLATVVGFVRGRWLTRKSQGVAAA